MGKKIWGVVFFLYGIYMYAGIVGEGQEWLAKQPKITALVAAVFCAYIVWRALRKRSEKELLHSLHLGERSDWQRFLDLLD